MLSKQGCFRRCVHFQIISRVWRLGFPPSRIGINFGAISMNSIQDANSNKTRKRSPMFKILIVDPNDPFRQSLKKVLVNRFPSVDIQEAADGNEGLQKVEDFHPHLIFLEIHLPAETGLELAGRIKADHPNIIIVILTSYDLPEYQAAAEKMEVEHIVPKDDWTGEDMIALVRSILSDLELDEQVYKDPDKPRQQTS
jgi:CheY-like chemotaxis protein